MIENNKRDVIELLDFLLADGLYVVTTDTDPLNLIRIVPVNPQSPPPRVEASPNGRRSYLPPIPWLKVKDHVSIAPHVPGPQQCESDAV